MKIYEQDIQTWQATVEHHHLQIQKAPAGKEKEYQLKHDAALVVQEALLAYKATVEMYPTEPAAYNREPFDS